VVSLADSLTLHLLKGSTDRGPLAPLHYAVLGAGKVTDLHQVLRQRGGLLHQIYIPSIEYIYSMFLSKEELEVAFYSQLQMRGKHGTGLGKGCGSKWRAVSLPELALAFSPDLPGSQCKK
jgi:hypothetical protein